MRASKGQSDHIEMHILEIDRNNHVMERATKDR